MSAGENMAMDEAIFLQSQGKSSPPTIRFYTWLVPAVSIGYFQQVNRDIDLATCRRMSVDVVRRPTGGKAVFHQHDLTYSVVGFEQRNGFPADILGTYQMISRCLIRSLRVLGMEAEMSGEGRTMPAILSGSLCFSAPSRYELLVRERKICGSAQVRSRGSFLQHGSLLLGFDPVKTSEILVSHQNGRDRQTHHLRESVTSLNDEGIALPDMGTLCRILKEGFEKTLDIQLYEGVLTEEEAILKERLLKHKYMNENWNIEGRAEKWSWQS